MNINPAVLERLEEFEDFSLFIMELVTGAGMRAAARAKEREFITDAAVAEKILFQFDEEIEHMKLEGGIREELNEELELEKLDSIEDDVTLGIVNEAIFQSSRELYEEIEDIITAKNENQSAAEILAGAERSRSDSRERE